MANIPDKIYLREVDLVEVGDFLSENNDKTDIEYIRKDVLIEKACDLFRRIDCDDTIPPYETTEEFIKVFKNYMKGVI